MGGTPSSAIQDVCPFQDCSETRRAGGLHWLNVEVGTEARASWLGRRVMLGLGASLNGGELCTAAGACEGTWLVYLGSGIGLAGRVWD